MKTILVGALALYAPFASADTETSWADASQVAKAEAELGLPRPLALAATWDRELVRKSYATLGARLAQQGQRAAQAPSLEVLRDPRRGDAAANFGEDPFLTGELGVAAVQGLQPQIAALIGPFAGPSLPLGDLGPMPVAPRELREVFMAPFETVIRRAAPAAVLLADNALDGLPSTSNPALVRILKQEWNFKGAVLATPAGVRGLEQRYRSSAAPVGEEWKLPANGAVQLTAENPARQAAREAVVLLKNDGSLPLVKKVQVLRVDDASPAALAKLKVPKPPYVLVLSGKLPVPSEALTHLVERASAVLAGFELGAEGPAALDEALAGRINPGGKLPFSLARNVGQLPMFYNVKPTAWRGYLFDTTKPLYPFGWGLSYTRFEIAAPVLAKPGARIGEPLFVSVEVRNAGKRVGDEVVQIYLHHRTASTAKPITQLVAFERVSLAPAESRRLEFKIDVEQLSLWNEAMQRVQEAGEVELLSGSNSVDLKSTLVKIEPQ